MLFLNLSIAFCELSRGDGNGSRAFSPVHRTSEVMMLRAQVRAVTSSLMNQSLICLNCRKLPSPEVVLCCSDCLGSGVAEADSCCLEHHDRTNLSMNEALFLVRIAFGHPLLAAGMSCAGALCRTLANDGRIWTQLNQHAPEPRKVDLKRADGSSHFLRRLRR